MTPLLLAFGQLDDPACFGVLVRSVALALVAYLLLLAASIWGIHALLDAVHWPAWLAGNHRHGRGGGGGAVAVPADGAADRDPVYRANRPRGGPPLLPLSAASQPGGAADATLGWPRAGGPGCCC
ncbi:MAG: hypothetical protein WDN49_02060 [Acetobacteraceae bacterium]